MKTRESSARAGSRFCNFGSSAALPRYRLPRRSPALLGALRAAISTVLSLDMEPLRSHTNHARAGPLQRPLARPSNSAPLTLCNRLHGHNVLMRRAADQQSAPLPEARPSPCATSCTAEFSPFTPGPSFQFQPLGPPQFLAMCRASFPFYALNIPHKFEFP